MNNTNTIRHMSAFSFNNIILEDNVFGEKCIVINFSSSTILQHKNILHVLNLQKIIEGNRIVEKCIKDGYKLFDKNDAKTILDFIKKYSLIDIYIVCDAGLCRSFSTAISLMYIYNLDYTEYILKNNGVADKNIITTLTNKNFYETVKKITLNKKATRTNNILDDLFF